MYTIKEDTTLVGVSELRNRIDKILQEAQRHKVVITKRNKPIAILIPIDQYNDIEKFINQTDDYKLASLARSREKKSSKKDYVTIENALRKVRRLRKI